MNRYIAVEDTKNPRYIYFETEYDNELMKITTNEKQAYRFEDVFEAIAATVFASKETKTNWKVINIEEWEA